MIAPRTSLLLLVGAALATAACGEQQRPFHFSVPPGTDIDNSLEMVGRALGDSGHPPITVERHVGLITTKWEDTGKSGGLVKDKPGTLVKRFNVTVTRSASGAEVTVRMDLRRCAAGGFTIEETELKGACEATDGLPDAEQRELDVLGQELSKTLSKGR